MQIQGTNLSDKNIRLRFLLIVFMGIIAFGAVLYWRNITLSNAEYVHIDTQHDPAKHVNSGALRSANYQIEVEDASPSVR